jgi:manganese-dependent ADP-ribose/CDP-alcohol diphosphatase
MKFLIASLFAALIFFEMPQSDKSGGPGSDDQSQKPLFSFGVVADVQYCNCEPQGTRFYRLAPGRLREAVDLCNADSVAFLVNLGDLIDRDYKSYKTVLNIIDSSGVKTYHLIGNHDYSVEPKYKRRLPLPMPSKEGYYSFVYQDFRFIALNGNEISTYASTNKSIIKQAESLITTLKDSGAVNAIDWNGGVSTKQLGWLRTQLDESVAKGEKVFILCHFPAFPDDEHNLLNYRDVLAILKNYDNIIAWLNGHNHAGNYGNFNMIHFVTFKGMVETEQFGAFSIIDVYRNKIWINGSGRERSQILAY